MGRASCSSVAEMTREMSPSSYSAECPTIRRSQPRSTPTEGIAVGVLKKLLLTFISYSQYFLWRDKSLLQGHFDGLLNGSLAHEAYESFIRELPKVAKSPKKGSRDFSSSEAFCCHVTWFHHTGLFQSCIVLIEIWLEQSLMLHSASSSYVVLSSC